MRSHFEALEVRTPTYISWEGYKSTHNTYLGINEPREHKQGWKGTESLSAVEGSEAQGVLKQIAPGLEQRSSWSKAAAKKLQIYTCSALQLQGLGGTICPRKGGRVISSDLHKGALQASSCSEGQNPPRVSSVSFHLSAVSQRPTEQLKGDTCLVTSDSPEYIH